MQRNNLLLSAILTATLVTTGCAAKKIANQDAFDTLANQKAEQFAGDSEKALKKAEEAYIKAKEAELDFYAPLHMEQLRETLKKARTVELEGNTKETIQVCAKVVALYEGALKNKEKVGTLLPALIEQKNILDDIKSMNILPSDYQSGMDDFKELISLIEAGEQDKANKDSAAVLKDLQEIELDTMMTQHWQPAKDTLDKAEDEDADTKAAITYEHAEQLVDSSEQQIHLHYKDHELVTKTGKEALRAAQHALYIGREVSTLIRMNETQAETAALKFESYLADIGSAIHAEDVRFMSFQDQTLALKQHAEAQNEKATAPYKLQIVELNNQLKQLKAADQTNNSSPEVIAPPSVRTEATAALPVEPSTKKSVETPTEQAVEPVTETTETANSEVPAEPITEAPSQPATEMQLDEAEDPSESLVETPEPKDEEPAKTEKPAEPVVETPAEPESETPNEAESENKPVADTSTKPVDEEPAEPSADNTAQAN